MIQTVRRCGKVDAVLGEGNAAREGENVMLRGDSREGEGFNHVELCGGRGRTVQRTVVWVLSRGGKA